MDCFLKFESMKKELLVIVSHYITVKQSQSGTNHSSGAESSMRNKFGCFLVLIKYIQISFTKVIY